MFWRVSLEPGLWQRLRTEADDVFGPLTRAPVADHQSLARLELANRVMRETTRLHPAGVLSPREAARDVTVGGYRIPKGTLILWSAHLAGRDPRAWPEPLRFDPDRFQAPSDDQKALADMAWVPFGRGARNCIGFALAQMELTLVVGDMAEPSADPGSQDLIWCEGAIYNLGVTEALTAWRRLLGAGGSVAFTEPVWLVESPPNEIGDWWTSAYSAMSHRAGVEARIEAASFRTIGSFVLPASAWWDEYYEPLQDRIASLRQRLPDDPMALDVAVAAEAEIDYFRRFSDCYSYEFFIVQPAG